jgi:hypothetical protein
MISAARLAANRANAQRSTGPRTAAGKLRVAQNGRNSRGPTSAAGKRRSAQNARRHGLSHAASHAPELAQAIADLGHAYAGGSTDPELLAFAMRAAAAQIDLMRARHARVDLLAARPLDNLRRVAAIDWYERIARARHKVAIRALGALAARDRPSGRPSSPSPASCENEPNPTEPSEL